jgi:hypothetical protein
MEEPAAKGPETCRVRSVLKRAAARLGLLAGTLVLLTLVLEVATRLLTDTSPPLKENDSVLGHRYIRSFDGMVFVPEAGRKVRLRFNSVGFRGRDWSLEKPPGVRRIAIFGDSMVSGLEMDEPDILASQLERLLNQAQSRVRWEVLNFGLSGASPADQLVLYRELAARYQPDIVLGSYFCGNDLTDSTPQLSNNPRNYFELDDSGRLYQLPTSAVRKRFSDLLNRYSRFYVWQKEATRGLRYRVQKQTATASSIAEWAAFYTGEEPELEHAWKVGAAVVREFARQAESNGSQFVLLVIPSAKQIYRDHFLEIIEASGRPAEQFDQDLPDKRLAAICREAKISSIPLTEALRAAAPSGSVQVEKEWLFNNGRLHWNKQGNHVAAEAICRYLADAKDEAPTVAKSSSRKDGRR